MLERNCVYLVIENSIKLDKSPLQMYQKHGLISKNGFIKTNILKLSN